MNFYEEILFSLKVRYQGSLVFKEALTLRYVMRLTAEVGQLNRRAG